MFIAALEYGSVVLILLFVVTQMVYPMSTNQPLFPMFRKRQKLHSLLEEIIEEERESELKRIIELEKAKLSSKNKSAIKERNSDEP